MVKLPKEMQKKAKKKPRRPQAVKQRPGGSSQYGSRQMRRKMAQQGIDMDQIEATRVLIETPEKTIVIEQPEVMLMKQMGQEIYQVIGSSEEFGPDEIQIGEESAIAEDEEREDEEVKPTITENDIMLVAAQTGVEKEVAKVTLEDCEGDIAKAILFLKNRP